MASDLSSGSIERALRGDWGRPHKVFDSIGSTNDEALSWARDGAPEGALVISDHQTSGRGRAGRSWYSEPGRALQFSLVLRPSAPVDLLGLLTTALGVACVRAIADVTGLSCGLKWPNDVQIAGRKAAGILVESSVLGETAVVVAGVGINVRPLAEKPPEEVASAATSLEGELGVSGDEPVNRSVLLAAVLSRAETLYPLAVTEEGGRTVVEAASRLSVTLGQKVRVRTSGGRMVEGRATALLGSGALLVSSDGGNHAIDAGAAEELPAS